jgi:hypothetical protein
MKPPILLTGWCGPEFQKIAYHTLPLMERYAKKHGMDFQCVNLHAEDAPPSWVKVPRIMAKLNAGHELVAWLDADVVIFDSSKSILDDVPPTAWQAVVEHETECGLVPNCGVWVTSAEMLTTLREVWWARDQYLTHPWWEQAAVMARMGYSLSLTSGWPSASRGTPTEVFERTAFLPAKWNHHPSDRRSDPKAAFIHVTQYANRAAACKEYASHAT